MNGIGLAGAGKLIDQVEDYLVQPGGQGAIASAIDALVARVFPSRFIELRVGPQEPERLPRPRLVAERIDQWNQANPGVVTSRHNLFDLVFGKRIRIDHLRMRLELVAIVELHHQYVYACFRQDLAYEFHRQGQFIGLWGAEVESSHGDRGCPGNKQCAGQEHNCGDCN